MSEQHDKRKDALPAHDPVPAISEEDAKGEIADLFADIRETMKSPMVTSIWRVLAADAGELRSSWQASRPIYENGHAAAAAMSLRTAIPVRLPAPAQGQLESVGFAADLEIVRAILAAYNWSNSLNFLALSALVSEPVEAASPEFEPALAQHRRRQSGLSHGTHLVVSRYVSDPSLVPRMVVIGHALAQWLDSAPSSP